MALRAAYGGAGALAVAIVLAGLGAATGQTEVSPGTLRALASAALTGGMILGALSPWVRGRPLQQFAAAALALLAAVGVCEAQAALAVALLGEDPYLAGPLGAALIAAPLFLPRPRHAHEHTHPARALAPRPRRRGA